MLQPPPRELTPEIRNHILWMVGSTPVFFVVGFWTLYGVALALDAVGYTLMSWRGTPIGPEGALFMAGVVTAFALLWTPPKLMRAFHLATDGVEATGTVRRKLGVTLKGIETVQVSYTYDSQVYTAKYGVELNELGPGATVNLIVDPVKPSRSLLRRHVFPRGLAT